MFQVFDLLLLMGNDGFLVGVVEVDIIFVIGLFKFGYFVWVKNVDGFCIWFKVCVFYLYGSGQMLLVLVQFDLGVGLLLLYYVVVECIVVVMDVFVWGLSLLVMYMYLGLGQYFGSDFYNIFGVNSVGFDLELFGFFSECISEVVICVYCNCCLVWIVIG